MFIKLKNAYIKKDIFIFFDFIKLNGIEIDGLDLIIGACLLQLDD